MKCFRVKAFFAGGLGRIEVNKGNPTPLLAVLVGCGVQGGAAQAPHGQAGVHTSQSCAGYGCRVAKSVAALQG